MILTKYFLCYRKFPAFKWAQRADTVIITIDAADAEQINVDVIEDKQTVHLE